jgi:hypothetical protein
VAHAITGAGVVEEVCRHMNTGQRSTVEEVIATGRHAIIAGSAGTGKTVVLKALVSIVERTFDPNSVLLLTPTLIAAMAAGPTATTLHSGMGIGRVGPDVTADSLVNAWIDSVLPRLRPALTSKKFLFIDEMWLGSNREMILVFIAWFMTHTAGGCQVICFGDAGQLHDWTQARLFSDDVRATLPGCPWPMSTMGLKLNPLVFELTEVWRQRDPLYLRALGDVRSGQPWKPGQSGFDAFKANCSPGLPRFAGLTAVVREDDGKTREVLTLAAHDAGWICLVATRKEAREGNATRREQAQARTLLRGATWVELTVTARVSIYNLVNGSLLATADAVDTLDEFASQTFWPGMFVSVAERVDAVTPAGVSVNVPTRLIGKVEAVFGSSLGNAGVHVAFPKSKYTPAFTHTFVPTGVDSDDIMNNLRRRRTTIQLDEGGYMPIRGAQSLEFPKFAADFFRVNGKDEFCRALIYGATTRGTVFEGLLLLNMDRGVNLANKKAIAWVTGRAADTAKELALRPRGSWIGTAGV